MKRAVLALSVAVLAGLLPSGVGMAAAVHRATLPGVTLLPPVGAGARPTAAIDRDVNLRIEIFRLVADSATGSPVGPSFSRAGAVPGTTPIRLHGPSDYRTDHYHANWGTRQSKLPNGSTVRVEVRLPSATAGTPACNSGVDLDAGCIGYFDVLLRKAKKGTAPAGFIGVQNGRTLPIRIHIADGALDPAPPDDTGGDEPITELKGEPDSPATAAIPDMKFQFDPDDYAPHDGMGGQVVSFDVLYLAFKLEVSVAEANSLLQEIGAEIIGGRPGKAGEFAGFLLVRVATQSHFEMDALIDRLNLDARVLVAVQDSLLETTALPKAGTAPGAWSWGIPGGDNWGLEAIRAPQMWNLNDYVEKLGQTNTVGVLDGGFYDHTDLFYDTKLTPLETGEDADHGTHVAGIIAARFDNEYGVEGVDPYARLVIQSYDSDKGGWGLYDFLENAPDVQVVNVSLGNNWYQHPPKTEAEAAEKRDLVKGQAVIFELWQIQFVAKGRQLPLIVGAAGNDSNSAAFSYDIGAEWNSPWDYAAIKDGIDNVIVVEAVQLQGDGSMKRAYFSNIHGQIAAPGYDICSTATPKKRDLSSWPENACGGEANQEPEKFMLDSGTSMAAPHVTGLAGYLLSIDPTLTPQELRTLLIDNGVPATGTPSPVIDAFASAMAIDGLRNNSAVLRGLLDIDDGTVDGNLRLDCSTTCADFTEDDFDFDRARGDGSIDMSDFRRWRDWFLLATEAEGLALDGNPSSPKNDVNRDGFFSTGGFENTYPAGDFNGDGKLDETATKVVPGYLNLAATDLGVLQSLFSDPDVPASRLPGLIKSLDIHVDPSACMGEGVIGVETKIFETTDMYWVDGRFERSPSLHEYTMPYRDGGYTVRLEALDTNGNVVGVAQNSFAAPLGSDSWFVPSACGQISITPKIVSVSLNKGETATATAHLLSAGVDANWEFTNTVQQVEPGSTGGTIQAGGDVAIPLKLTCPSIPKSYGGVLYFKFTDANGGIINKAVPEWLGVNLFCLEGSVVTPETLNLTLKPGQTGTVTIKLTNNGTALKYEAIPHGDLIGGDPASGDLAQLGESEINLTAKCPDQPGDYSGSVTLTFTRADGKPVEVEVPESVQVNLKCEWPAPLFTWRQQSFSNAISLDFPDQYESAAFNSYPSTGVGTWTYQHDNQTTTTEKANDDYGFGSGFSQLSRTGSFDFCQGEYCEDPLTRTRTASSTVTFGSAPSGPVPTVTFTGGYSMSYGQTGYKTTFATESVNTSTTMKFALSGEAELHVTWTCDHDCLISLLRECGCVNTSMFPSGQGQNADFTVTLPPGEYVFFLSNSLPISSDTSDVSKRASYELVFTFPTE